ncbi:MAG TPA: hypothetical protein DEV87_05265 [Clostridiales bacterium]|nr:hypothetical protein [Clostridiales bacterium]
MKVLKRLLIALLIMVLLAGALVAGAYFYVKNTYGIDVFKTIGQLKTLGREVDEAELCPNAFSESDMASVDDEINASVDGFISYTEENGYKVNFDDLPSEMKTVIKLTDKQVGAVADTVVRQEMNGEVEIADKKVPVKLLQVAFGDIDESGNADFNVVVRLDLKPLTADVDEGAKRFVGKYLPEFLYVSSTVRVTRGAGFEFAVAHKTLTLNNLSAKDTEEFLGTLDKLMGIGTAQTLNETIGNTVLSSLIGSETQNGLAYSLKNIGATGYTFATENGVNYFEVLR